ncbi:hypothetical protein RND81_08G218900 [Saponaria officinalis]|uniref:MBD domain-containing protein n=1 Tax=Saponaria officinalis TaxID=3572 RepID=A0AAW1JBF8_SAPOF
MPRQPPTRDSTPSRIVRRSNWKPIPLNFQTLENMEARGFKMNVPRPKTGSVSYVHDSSSPAYSWLLPGWLAEERLLPHGRVYKYYYDPAGRQYRNKYEVIDQWENLGIIVLDA